MSIAQCFGAASSYARKYALNALLLIDDVKDDDAKHDINNQQSKSYPTPQPATNKNTHHSDPVPYNPSTSQPTSTEIIPPIDQEFNNISPTQSVPKITIDEMTTNYETAKSIQQLNWFYHKAKEQNYNSEMKSHLSELYSKNIRRLKKKLKLENLIVDEEKIKTLPVAIPPEELDALIANNPNFDQDDY